MRQYDRNAKFTQLKQYCLHSNDTDYMEVTEWYNGEGFDVVTNNKHFSLTNGEWECLQALVNYRG
jgi:hypothetical protein